MSLKKNKNFSGEMHILHKKKDDYIKYISKRR